MGNPMFAEVRNDYQFGPLFLNADSTARTKRCMPNPDEDGILGGITIDAWKSADSDENGEVIATVIVTPAGDIAVVWHDNGARMDEEVLTAIKEAKETLSEAYREVKAVVKG